MTNYDGAIINLYEPNSFISSHNDVDESKSAINYPVIGINIGGTGNFSIESRDGNPLQLNLKAGSGYIFGLNGVNRNVFHRTFPKPQDSFLPELTTKIDGKTYEPGSYRITITMRRVMPLEPGMPNQPTISTQTQAPIIETAPILNNKIEPGRYVRFNNETFIVTKINVNDTIQIYNPTLEGAAAKKSVAMRNLELLNNKAEIVKHKGSSYIVTPKETIISLTSNKAMNWGEENGDRKEILLKSKDKATTEYSAWNEISEENRKNLFRH
jgi:hypothetical protein